MEEYIHFLSNVKDFKEDKKIVIDSTKNIDILNYYISIQSKINNKVSLLLEKVIDVKKLEKENNNLFLLDENGFFKELNSSAFKKKINEILTDYEKDLKKALFLSCKVYLIEKYFSKKGISPSFHKL